MFCPAAPIGLPLRFSLFIDGLCRTVAAHIARDRAAGALIILIWQHLRRKAARAQAGPLPAPQPRAAARTRPPHPRRLPGSFAWLIRHIPATAAQADQLQQFLADPEMAALLTAAPQTARLLHPLCRALGIAPLPEPLRPPARSPVPAIRTARPAVPADPPLPPVCPALDPPEIGPAWPPPVLA